MPRRRQLLISFTAVPLLPVIALLPTAVFAQAFPDHLVKLVVGFPAGTGPDVVARTLGLKLQDNLKQAVVIDNRAGAGGQIGALAVAKASADGYTLLLAEVGSISIAPAAYSKLPYDPARELTPVAEVVRSDFVLVVPPNSPVRDVKAFVAAAKSRPDRVNFGTFGAGTPGHFGAEMFGELAGFKIEPIHYRATGDAITALVAGDVHGAFVTTALAAPQIKAGKVRALATTAQARSPLLPEVPTFAESGLPQVDFSAWFALMAPAETPAATLDLLNRATLDALQSAQVRKTLEEAGFTITGTSRADAARMTKSEAVRWASAVKASGFKAD
jgi:tripartite-type tricarboxylate transporter receptor subunit TctC